MDSDNGVNAQAMDQWWESQPHGVQVVKDWEIAVLIFSILFVVVVVITCVTAIYNNIWWTNSSTTISGSTGTITGATGILPTGSPISYLTDNNNCGGTGIVCNVAGGQLCKTGVCTCLTTGAVDCSASTPTGTFTIGCVRITSDVNNCGGCGKVCNTGFVQPGCCSSKCVDLTKIQNCGSCGNLCTGVTPGCCGGTCADLNTDPNNCGMCFRVCATGFKCCGAGCISVSADNNNCGNCNIVCTGITHCQSGACAPGCPSGTIQCGDSCVNTASDNNNCLACGNVCPGGTFCINSRCQSNRCFVASGTTPNVLFCPQNGFCNGLNQPTSCGFCGNICNLTCNNNLCTCATQADCNTNFTCQTGSDGTQSCVPAFACGVGTTFCPNSSSCVDLNFSASNCGQCNTQCIATGGCSNGLCVCATDSDCDLGFVCISGLCALR